MLTVPVPNDHENPFFSLRPLLNFGASNRGHSEKQFTNSSIEQTRTYFLTHSNLQAMANHARPEVGGGERSALVRAVLVDAAAAVDAVGAAAGGDDAGVVTVCSSSSVGEDRLPLPKPEKSPRFLLSPDDELVDSADAGRGNADGGPVGVGNGEGGGDARASDREVETEGDGRGDSTLDENSPAVCTTGTASPSPAAAARSFSRSAARCFSRSFSRSACFFCSSMRIRSRSFSTAACSAPFFSSSFAFACRSTSFFFSCSSTLHQHTHQHIYNND